MARCGCAGGGTCSCKVEAGDNATVTGNGGPTTPFVISFVSPDPEITGLLEVTDTTSIDLTLSGTGTSGDPYNISADLVAAYIAELIRDTMGTALVAGTNIAVTVNDAGDTITIATTGVSTIVESVNTVAATGSTETVPDVTTATINHFTLDANCTLTFPAAVAGKSFTLVLKQDATGSRTVTWPGTVKWPGGTTPTLTTTAAKSDVFSFMCADGTNWLGFTAGQAY